LYYNFAAESFLSKKLCSTLHSTEVEFYKKKEMFAFEPHFRRLKRYRTHFIYSSLESPCTTSYSS